MRRRDKYHPIVQYITVLGQGIRGHELRVYFKEEGLRKLISTKEELLSIEHILNTHYNLGHD